MNAPLSKKTLSKLEQLFKAEQEKCNKLFQDMVQEAEEKGKDFDKSLASDEVIVSYRQILKYFKKRDLMQDAGQMLANFNSFVAIS